MSSFVRAMRRVSAMPPVDGLADGEDAPFEAVPPFRRILVEGESQQSQHMREAGIIVGQQPIIPVSRGCFGANGGFPLRSSLSNQKRTACRHRSGYPTFNCSLISATSEPEMPHQTKSLSHNGSLSCSRSPSWSFFSFLWDTCGDNRGFYGYLVEKRKKRLTFFRDGVY